MNAKDESVIELAPESFSRREERNLPSAITATPMSMLAMAVSQGADLDKISKLMDLQERYEKAESVKAFNAAFAAFKAEAIQVIKNRRVDAGPLSGKRYAELFSVVNAVTPALSRNGLSASWKLTKDDKDWLEVTCTLRHVLGHSDSVSMGGPPDAGGAKSAIQARASTVSYLERYTLKAICGVSEQGDDTNGAATKAPEPPAKPEPQPYPAESFSANFPKWAKLVESGKKTPADIIRMVGSKAILSELQKADINAIEGPKVDTEFVKELSGDRDE